MPIPEEHALWTSLLQWATIVFHGHKLVLSGAGLVHSANKDLKSGLEAMKAFPIMNEWHLTLQTWGTETTESGTYSWEWVCH